MEAFLYYRCSPDPASGRLRLQRFHHGSLLNTPQNQLTKAAQKLALAELLHDAVKIRCTREESGVLVSPGHGAAKARHVAWLCV